MAEIYSHVKDDKVVLSLRGREAVQYVSNAELMRMGRQVVESIEASRAARTKKEGAEPQEHNAEGETEPEQNEPAERVEASGASAMEVEDAVGDGNGAAVPASEPAADDGDGQHFEDGLSSDSDIEIRFKMLNDIS